MEELEALSQQAQTAPGQTQHKEPFRAKAQGGRPGHPAGRGAASQAKKGQKQQSGKGRKSEQASSARRPVGAEVCPVEQVIRPETATALPPDFSLFDDLGAHLDEAFVLQEILGKPRCMQEFE